MRRLNRQKGTSGIFEGDADELWYGEQPTEKQIEDGGSGAKEESALDGDVELFGWYFAEYLGEGLAHILVVININ